MRCCLMCSPAPAAVAEKLACMRSRGSSRHVLAQVVWLATYWLPQACSAAHTWLTLNGWQSSFIAWSRGWQQRLCKPAHSSCVQGQLPAVAAISPTPRGTSLSQAHRGVGGRRSTGFGGIRISGPGAAREGCGRRGAAQQRERRARSHAAVLGITSAQEQAG